MNSNLPKSILVRIKATHFNFVNKNAVFYTEDAVRKGAASWTKPYNKPQLIGHDKKSDPIGRVIDYKIIKSQSTNEPPDYVELTVKITDSASIEKVLDGRYNTVSVGSKTSRVVCSECSQVITEDGLCEHKKGSYNEDGKPIYWRIEQIDYVEDSFVNEPADEYSGITFIDIGKGWVDYTEFLDNRESMLALTLEDNTKENDMTVNTDAKLSTAQREKLPESSFCGPGRSFPAHDKAHVTAGLRLLNRAKVSDSTKTKIKACLYRKGKQYGITPSNDELQENPDLLTFRLADDFSDEEVKTIQDWFTANPDSDLPEPEVPTTTEDNTETPVEKDYTKMTKPELVDHVKLLLQQIEDSKKLITDKDSEIALKDEEIKKLETLNLGRADEVSKLLDEAAILEKKFRDSIISNIIDLKLTDNNSEEAKELRDKLLRRKIESLQDTLDDSRSEKKLKIENSDKVVDPTLTDNINSAEKKENDSSIEQNSDENKNSKFSIFSEEIVPTEGE